MINAELENFSPKLAERPQIVLGNKCDVATEEQIAEFRSYIEEKGLLFLPISAATRQGLDDLPGIVFDHLKELPPIQIFQPEYVKKQAQECSRSFTVSKTEAHTFSVDAPWLERILEGSNVDDYESLQYFQTPPGEPPSGIRPIRPGGRYTFRAPLSATTQIRMRYWITSALCPTVPAGGRSCRAISCENISGDCSEKIRIQRLGFCIGGNRTWRLKRRPGRESSC